MEKITKQSRETLAQTFNMELSRTNFENESRFSAIESRLEMNTETIHHRIYALEKQPSAHAQQQQQQQQQARNRCALLFLVTVVVELTRAMDVERDAGGGGTGSGRRRRERRLRQWHRHERMTVAMALAEFTHHSAPRGQKTARARGRGAS